MAQPDAGGQGTEHKPGSRSRSSAHRVQQLLDMRQEGAGLHRHAHGFTRLAGLVSAGRDARVLCHVPRANLHPDRHALLPNGETWQGVLWPGELINGGRI